MEFEYLLIKGLDKDFVTKVWTCVFSAEPGPKTQYFLNRIDVGCKSKYVGSILISDLEFHDFLNRYKNNTLEIFAASW